MKSRLPKMAQLEALNAIVKYGSINAAARALNIAQPSLSRSIKELEELLNTQLIIRGSMGISLTPAGESFATNSAMILESMTRAIDQTYLMSGKTDTLVRFGGSPISVRSVVRPALECLMDEFPNCRIHVDDNPIERHIKQLRNGFLDFAIGNGGSEVSLSEFIVEPLFECPFYITCVKGHPLENATHLSDASSKLANTPSETAPMMPQPRQAASFSAGITTGRPVMSACSWHQMGLLEPPPVAMM